MVKYRELKILFRNGCHEDVRVTCSPAPIDGDMLIYERDNGTFLLNMSDVSCMWITEIEVND